MKIILFGTDIRKLRQQAAVIGRVLPDMVFAYRDPKAFDPDKIEATDKVIIDGDFPAIAKAYDGKQFDMKLLEPKKEEAPQPTEEKPAKKAGKAGKASPAAENPAPAPAAAVATPAK